jgi:hypothetical protein
MFDIRPLQRFNSMMIVLICLGTPFVSGALIAGMSIGLAESGRAKVLGAVVGGAVALLGPLLGGLPLLWLASTVHTGASTPLLRETARLLGADASVAGLFSPMLWPRLSGRIDGRAFRVDLLRRGGVMGPREVGPRGPLSWVLTFHTEVRLPERIGFARPGAENAVASALLGLHGEERAEGFVVWTGRQATSRRIATDPAVLRAVQDALPEDVGPTLLRVGPKAIEMSWVANSRLEAPRWAAWVRALHALANAVEAAAR